MVTRATGKAAAPRPPKVPKAVKSPKAPRAPKPVPDRKAPLSLEVREVFTDIFSLSEEEIDFFRTPVEHTPTGLRPVTFLHRDALGNQPGRDHGLSTHRIRMAEWVLSNLSLRQAEADCNLDCYACPAAQLLMCTAVNEEPALRDGFTLHAADPQNPEVP